MAKASKPAFCAALIEPIYKQNLGLLNPEFEKKRISSELNAKFELLLDHYKIDRDSPNYALYLAIELAFDFVPGMQVVASPIPKRGRPKKWDLRQTQELVSAVEKIANERRRGISDAIRVAVKRNPDRWPTKDGRMRKTKKEFAALETRYHEQKARIKKINEAVRQAPGGLLGLGGAILRGKATKNYLADLS